MGGIRSRANFTPLTKGADHFAMALAALVAVSPATELRAGDSHRANREDYRFAMAEPPGDKQLPLDQGQEPPAPSERTSTVAIDFSQSLNKSEFVFFEDGKIYLVQEVSLPSDLQPMGVSLEVKRADGAPMQSIADIALKNFYISQDKVTTLSDVTGILARGSQDCFVCKGDPKRNWVAGGQKAYIVFEIDPDLYTLLTRTEVALRLKVTTHKDLFSKCHSGKSLYSKPKYESMSQGATSCDKVYKTHGFFCPSVDLARDHIASGEATPLNIEKPGVRMCAFQKLKDSKTGDDIERSAVTVANVSGFTGARVYQAMSWDGEHESYVACYYTAMSTNGAQYSLGLFADLGSKQTCEVSPLQTEYDFAVEGENWTANNLEDEDVAEFITDCDQNDPTRCPMQFAEPRF